MNISYRFVGVSYQTVLEFFSFHSCLAICQFLFCFCQQKVYPTVLTPNWKNILDANYFLKNNAFCFFFSGTLFWLETCYLLRQSHLLDLRIKWELVITQLQSAVIFCIAWALEFSATTCISNNSIIKKNSRRKFFASLPLSPWKRIFATKNRPAIRKYLGAACEWKVWKH